ncbi:ribosomal protein S18-alanine N-acetyltransferase [Haloimpatiens sp. FM7315]|uniref:ribosomal protein S18-alanine N-acetyltransferase n=1 Tax=Haloimpatiens sp. FM7315 TaxID=3298609 RepID=UPI0035A2FC51
MENTVIKTLNQEHIDEVLKINALSFPDPWHKNSFEKELKNNFAHYIIALNENVLVGYAGIWIIVDEAHIISIAVHPEYRGAGISNKLMSKLIEICIENKVPNITLEVRKSNIKAQNLYRKFGFLEEGQRKKYYSDGEDALIMWKRNMI